MFASIFRVLFVNLQAETPQRQRNSQEEGDDGGAECLCDWIKCIVKVTDVQGQSITAGNPKLQPPCVFTQEALLLFNRKLRCFCCKHIREAAAAETNDRRGRDADSRPATIRTIPNRREWTGLLEVHTGQPASPDQPIIISKHHHFNLHANTPSSAK